MHSRFALWHCEQTGRSSLHFSYGPRVSIHLYTNGAPCSSQTCEPVPYLPLSARKAARRGKVSR